MNENSLYFIFFEKIEIIVNILMTAKYKFISSVEWLC